MLRTLRAHREIALVLTVFVVLGIFYSVTTPLFEAPDEQWHYAFVQNVATGRGLPIQTTGTLTHLARQEGSQPPLYYVLAAAATFWIDSSDYPGIVWENPHYGFNVPGVVNDNKNLFIHTSLESFPWHGAALAIHLARWLSVLMGALSVLFTYLLTLEIFPDRKYLAASAAALAGFVPQFLFVSSAVSNDSTIVAMSALALWMTVRLFLVEPGWRDMVLLGIATGLAALAKVSGLGLSILGALVLVYVFRKHPKLLVLRLSVFGAVVFAVAGWWYLRNVLLYGEITGTTMMTRIFGARETPLTTMQLLTQLREVWETFWVGFGWGNIRANAALYTALEIFVIASGMGLVLAFVRRRERLHPTLVKALPFFVMAFWIAVAFIELVNWMQITQAPHGRLFFPALPAIAPLAVFGLTQWAPRRFEPWVARGAAVALCGLAIYAPLAIVQPAYAFPPTLTSNDLAAITHRVDIAYEGKMKLLGYAVTPRRVLPGDAVTLTLYWQALATMDTDYSIGIHALDSNGRVIAARDSYPGHGMLPTRLWLAGQMLRDDYWLPIAADALAPDVAQIQVSLYDRATKRDLTAFDPSGQAITPLIGAIKVASATPAQVPHPQSTLNYNFGKNITLIGYDLRATNELDLTLYWQSRALVANDYTVFVHVLDANNASLVAQHDQMPANGTNPTSLWDTHEVVADHYTIALPNQGSGLFNLQIGMYRADTGERLPIMDAQGKVLGDAVIVGSFGVLR